MEAGKDIPRFDDYTCEEEALIRRGVADGLTYTEIAAKIPRRTVKAVSNKINRMGLKARRSDRPASKSQRDYLRRILRESEKGEPDTNVAQDEAFQRALKKAVAEGLEHVEEGVNLQPCTDNPKPVRPYAIQFSRSPALMCFELGDNTRDIFA